jgi:ketosteroid isomerase-like protein
MPDRDLVDLLYARFNARDIDAVLELLAPDVVWANGMEGGHEHGHEAVRAYWSRQWQLIDPRVDPVSTVFDGGTAHVEVHQVVRDLGGAVLADEMVGHIFTFAAGKVVRFDIRGK